MHSPADAQHLVPPFRLKPYMVATFEATRADLRASLGAPDYVETDSTRTFGGDEDNWAWELGTGQRILVVLRVPYKYAVLYSDPPDSAAAAAALGIEPEGRNLTVLAEPMLDPCYRES